MSVKYILPFIAIVFLALWNGIPAAGMSAPLTEEQARNYIEARHFASRLIVIVPEGELNRWSAVGWGVLPGTVDGLTYDCALHPREWGGGYIGRCSYNTRRWAGLPDKLGNASVKMQVPWVGTWESKP